MSCGSLSQFSPNFEQPMPTMATWSRMACGFIAAGAYGPASGAARGARRTLPWKRRRLREGSREQRVDRRLAVGPEEARARAAEARLPDEGGILGAPSLAAPAEPSVALLVEDVKRRVQDLRKLAGHAGATGHGVVRVDPAHDEDLLGVVHLVPDRLQHFAEERRVGILAVHELAQVAEAHVAAPQLGAREDAPTTLAHGVVPLEGEVDLVDAVALRGGAEGRFRARRAAAEENAVLAPHVRSSPGTFSPIARMWSNGCATRSSTSPSTTGVASAPPRRPRASCPLT